MHRQVVNRPNINAMQNSKFILSRNFSPSYESPFASSENEIDSTEQEKSEKLRDFTKETKTFEVIEIIGAGGFGIVAKVVNKNIRNQVYAVKRVPLDKNEKNNLKIIREADLLSRLNHSNVVRYFHTWRETHEVTPNRTRTESTVERDENESIMKVSYYVSCGHIIYVS